MPLTDLFFKVEIEHAKDEDLERRGREILRQLRKIYGVESAELSSYVTVRED